MTSLQSVENVDPARQLPWPSPRSRHRTKTEPEFVDTSVAINMLASRASSVTKDRINILIATVVRGEPLRLHVDRVFARHGQVDRDRIYQRLKRRRGEVRLPQCYVNADDASGLRVTSHSQGTVVAP